MEPKSRQAPQAFLSEVLADRVAPFERELPVRICINGPIDEASRPGLLSLAADLMDLGFDDFVVSVEKMNTMDTEGAAALIEMLQIFADNGSEAHLTLSPRRAIAHPNGRMGERGTHSWLGRPLWGRYA
jgi:hypothetical protein